MEMTYPGSSLFVGDFHVCVIYESTMSSGFLFNESTYPLLITHNTTPFRFCTKNVLMKNNVLDNVYTKNNETLKNQKRNNRQHSCEDTTTYNINNNENIIDNTNNLNNSNNNSSTRKTTSIKRSTVIGDDNNTIIDQTTQNINIDEYPNIINIRLYSKLLKYSIWEIPKTDERTVDLKYFQPNTNKKYSDNRFEKTQIHTNNNCQFHTIDSIVTLLLRYKVLYFINLPSLDYYTIFKDINHEFRTRSTKWSSITA